MGSAIGLARFDMARGERFESHLHDDHQLAWAPEGALMADAGGRYWVLPPALALWIPGGVRHAIVALRASVLQGVYIDPQDCSLPWREPTVVAVSPLARNLIEYLAGTLGVPERLRAESVLMDVLRPVGRAAVELPLPADERARDVADLLLGDPADQRGLDELARVARSSPRTLLRLFLQETGMTFADWRARARLQASIVLLAEGQPVARVAPQVGYATASAFVAAFKRVTGHTPAAYFSGMTEKGVAARGAVDAARQ